MANNIVISGLLLEEDKEDPKAKVLNFMRNLMKMTVEDSQSTDCTQTGHTICYPPSPDDCEV